MYRVGSSSSEDEKPKQKTATKKRVAVGNKKKSQSDDSDLDFGVKKPKGGKGSMYNLFLCFSTYYINKVDTVCYTL